MKLSRFLFAGLILPALFTIEGCDRRGPAERAFDQALSKEKDPKVRAMAESGRPLVQQQDRMMSNMTTEQRKEAEALSNDIKRNAPTTAEINGALDNSHHVDVNQTDPGAAYRNQLQAASPAYNTMTSTPAVVSPAYLGIDWEVMQRSTSVQAGLLPGIGVYVRNVRQSSPAAYSGVQPGDVIVSANGLQLSAKYNLNQAKAGLAAGATMKFRILRNGKPMDMQVTLSSIP